jgi:hypothetical protein
MCWEMFEGILLLVKWSKGKNICSIHLAPVLMQYGPRVFINGTVPVYTSFLPFLSERLSKTCDCFQ